VPAETPETAYGDVDFTPDDVREMKHEAALKGVEHTIKTVFRAELLGYAELLKLIEKWAHEVAEEDDIVDTGATYGSK
jgi:hypothetical protein